MTCPMHIIAMIAVNYFKSYGIYFQVKRCIKLTVYWLELYIYTYNYVSRLSRFIYSNITVDILLKC